MTSHRNVILYFVYLKNFFTRCIPSGNKFINIPNNINVVSFTGFLEISPFSEHVLK